MSEQEFKRASKKSKYLISLLGVVAAFLTAAGIWFSNFNETDNPTETQIGEQNTQGDCSPNIKDGAVNVTISC